MIILCPYVVIEHRRNVVPKCNRSMLEEIGL